MNKRKTYAIVNSETKKIIKYAGKLLYFRTYAFAIREKEKLERELEIGLKIVKKC